MFLRFKIFLPVFLLIFSSFAFFGYFKGTALISDYVSIASGNNANSGSDEDGKGLHIEEITAYCTGSGIAGKVTFKNESDESISKSVNLFLTYHTPGASIWLPSGGNVDINISLNSRETITKNYSLTAGTVPFYANSIRVENKWDPTKSESFKPCTAEVKPSVTPTAVPTQSVTPSLTPSATPTQVPSVTSTPKPTATPTVTPTATLTPTLTLTPTPKPTETVVPSLTPTVTPTPNPTVSLTVTPTLTPTATPSQVPTLTPSLTPTATLTPTPTPIPSSPTPTGTAGLESRCYDLEASPVEGSAPLTVKFTGHADDPVSGGKIKEYRFDFGDASDGQPQIWSQSESIAYHRYVLPGEYEAKLKIQDNAGNWRESDDCKVKIKVSNTPQVLGVKTPEVLPQTGISIALINLSLIVSAIAGRFLYKRFRLV